MIAAPSAPPQTILFLINSLEGGGAERIVALLLDEFERELNREYGFEVELALLDDRPFAYDIPAGVPVHRGDARGSLPRSVAGLFHRLRRRRPALVFSHLARANFSAALVCRRLGIPCMIMEHVNTSSHFGKKDFHSWMSRCLVRWLYPRADRVVAVSEGVAEELMNRYSVQTERVTVIPTPFDVDRIRALAARPAENPLPASFVVAVGRLTANKNFTLLLEAYADARIAPDLVILGQGDAYPLLVQRAAELEIAERVHFLGFVDNPYTVMRRAEAFVSSSNAEGFPVAAGEALTLGLPVLMTECPSGPAELLGGRAPPGAGVVRGAYGLLTPVGDRAAMADGLRMIVGAEMRALAERGRARMEDCRPQAIARRHAQTMASLLRS